MAFKTVGGDSGCGDVGGVGGGDVVGGIVAVVCNFHKISNVILPHSCMLLPHGYAMLS
jgi:hypothetical protein